MTAPLRLDLIKKGEISSLNFTWIGFSLLLTGLACLIVALQYHTGLLDEASELQVAIDQAELALLEKQPKAKQLPQAEINPKAMKVLQSANQTIEVPWTTLLNTLEDTQHKHVALLDIQPDSNKQRLLIAGEAKNYASIIAYIEQLERQPTLQDVYLQKHQVSEGAGHPVQFTLGAVWLQNQEERSS